MRVFVTGANGFLGRFVVSALLEQGHEVTAAVRPASSIDRLPWADDERVSIARVDLRSRDGLAEAVAMNDAVIHVAAAKSGDVYAQMASTVVGTENLVAAMAESGVSRLVHVSSFSVYRYHGRIPGLLTEEAPLEDDEWRRDEYAVAKLRQESRLRELAGECDLKVTYVRPGFIYGPDNIELACLGCPISSRVWFGIGWFARVPATHAANCADALVAALDAEESVGETVNIVDDELPTRRAYSKKLRATLKPKPVELPVPYSVWRFGCWMIDAFDRLFLGRQLKVPSIVALRKFEARCRPQKYTNEKAKRVLGWTPRIGFDEAFAASARGEWPGVPAKPGFVPIGSGPERDAVASRAAG